jgi:16S rRNA (cytosine967-C5)-methyltransferase
LRSASFARGEITVQGETALRAAELVEARAGERVLDLCAAPGGKTAVLAESGAAVVATDASAERLARLSATLERLSLGDRVEILPIDALDGAELSPFDAVLVDAPCSNTGVLAQRPEARWRFGPPSQHALAAVQVELLAHGARHVRPGGRLVYSTCSIEPEENQRRVVAFLETQPDFGLEHEFDALPDPRGERGPVDGGYAARLRRR